MRYWSLGESAWRWLHCSEEGVFLGDQGGRISALNPHNQGVLWSSETPGALEAAPLVMDGVMYAPSTEGGVSVVDLASGALQRRLFEDKLIYTTPIYAQGHIWVGTLDGQLLALDIVTDLVSKDRYFQVGFFSSFACDDDETCLVWGEPDGTLCAFDMSKNKVRWRRSLHQPILQGPVIQGETVVVTSRGGQIAAFDLASGTQRWTRKWGALHHVPAVTEQQIFLPVDKALLALSLADGTTLWKRKQSGAVTASPIVAHETVFVSAKASWSNTSEVSALEQSSGQPLWREYVSGHTLSIGLFENELFLYSGNGYVGSITGQSERPKPKPPEPVEQVPVSQEEPASTPVSTPVYDAGPAQKSRPRTEPAEPVRSAQEEIVLKRIRSQRWETVSSMGSMFQGSLARRGQAPMTSSALAAMSSGETVSLGVESKDGVLWQKQMASGSFGAPVISGDSFYIGTLEGQLSRRHIHTGSLQWEVDLGGEIWSTPAIAGDKICVGCRSNKVLILDAGTGELLRTIHTLGKVDSSPVIDCNILYFGSDDGCCHAYWLNGDDVEPIWEYQTGGAIHSSPSLYRDWVLFGSRDNHLYALNRWDGRALWSFATRGWVYSSPAVLDSIVYVGSDDGYLYALDGRYGGVMLWRAKTGDEVPCSPAITDEMIYVGSRDGALYAFDRTYGDMKWTFHTGDYLYSSPVVAGDVVTFGSVDGYVYALDRHNGGFLWKHQMDSYVWSPVALDQHLVIAADKHGMLVAIKDAGYRAP